jgi:hypothetical protein
MKGVRTMNQLFRSKLLKGICLSFTIVILVFSIFDALIVTSPPSLAATSIPINLIFYGMHNATIDQEIINAHPEFLVDNSPAGPWKGNASISKFEGAGIKYFEYMTSGYEGTKPGEAIPNDLQDNENFALAVSKAGGYGVFLDEVSNQPTSTQFTYLSNFATYVHSLGLKLVFNPGEDDFSATLMNYCDYISGSETYNGGSLSPVEQKYSSRVWLLTQGVTNANTAASLTKSAWNKGVAAHYACNKYTALPSWFTSYISQISGNISPTSDFSLNSNKTTISFNSGGSSTFTISIVPSGGFAGNINLTAASNSSKLTVTPISTPLTLPYTLTTFNVKSSSSGSYKITITGTSGTLQHSITIPVSVRSSRR